jgi:hypothetical protein
LAACRIVARPAQVDGSHNRLKMFIPYPSLLLKNQCSQS